MSSSLQPIIPNMVEKGAMFETPNHVCIYIYIYHIYYLNHMVARKRICSKTAMTSCISRVLSANWDQSLNLSHKLGTAKSHPLRHVWPLNLSWDMFIFGQSQAFETTLWLTLHSYRNGAHLYKPYPWPRDLTGIWFCGSIWLRIKTVLCKYQKSWVWIFPPEHGQF